MEVLGWIIWAVGLLLSLPWAYGVRTYLRTGQGVQQATVNQTMLMLAAVLAFPLLNFSPFHLLWLLPVAFIVGMLSLAFPFSLVSVLGKPFGHIRCLGLDSNEVARNTQRVERFRELVTGGVPLRRRRNNSSTLTTEIGPLRSSMKEGETISAISVTPGGHLPSWRI